MRTPTEITQLIEKGIFERTNEEHLRFFIYRCSVYETRHRGKFDYEIKCTYIMLVEAGLKASADKVRARYAGRLATGDVAFPS